jgi:hypothetical protein
MDKILYQLDEYMKYNKMENHPINETLKNAFLKEDFHNVYIDKRTMPILKQQIWLLILDFSKLVHKSLNELRVETW